MTMDVTTVHDRTMARIVWSMAPKVPSFTGRKIEDLIKCETGVFRRRIWNAGEKLT